MSVHTPENLRYTKEHEWADLKDGEFITIGITDFAQSSLGDIVYLELPEVGTQIQKDAAFGVVESIKSVSDLYAPLGGEVVERNEELIESPEKINENAYSAWLVKIKLSNTADYETLLNAADYLKICN